MLTSSSPRSAPVCIRGICHAPLPSCYYRTIPDAVASRMRLRTVGKTVAVSTLSVLRTICLNDFLFSIALADWFDTLGLVKQLEGHDDALSSGFNRLTKLGVSPFRFAFTCLKTHTSTQLSLSASSRTIVRGRSWLRTLMAIGLDRFLIAKIREARGKCDRSYPSQFQAWALQHLTCVIE